MNDPTEDQDEPGLPAAAGLHVVLGASGSAGLAIVRALADAGHPVRAVNRSGNAPVPPGVETMAADITTRDGVLAAVAGAVTVYMAAQPDYHRWPELFPPMLEGVIDAVALDAGKLVMVDNLYGYGPGSSPMTEETAERATDGKGAARRKLTEMLLEAHRSGRLRVVIARASDYFGPDADNSAITALAVASVARPKAALRWMGSLDAAHSAAYLPDIARAYVTLGTDERADGEIWHLPHSAAITGTEFLGLVNVNLPEPRKSRVVSRLMLRIAAPFHKISKEALPISYQWTEPFIIDDTKFEKVFGPFERTPIATAVAATVAAYGPVS